MCLLDRFHNKLVVIGEIVLITVIGIVHVVLGFIMKMNDFNVYDLFDSSPLFDFELSNDCGNKSSLTFHRWGGRKVTDSEGDTYIKDETDLKKINGFYFCYNHKSYFDLLNNGQIIKNDSKCPSNYPTNCGILDTLEQELCIEEYNKCPLYDIGIGNKLYDDNYIYSESANVYYNKENYNEENKKIIGRLILNDGQPCYNPVEKLWRKFDSNEDVDSHLKCDIGVFDKYNDDRYKNKGSISYKRLYQDNLNSVYQKMILDDLNGLEEVSLYQNEFLGIDKECNDNYVLSKDSFAKFKSS